MPRSPPHSFFQASKLYIVGIDSLLLASYAAARRVVSTFPQLSLPETALAGSMAGAVLASPVQMFNVRIQGQCAAPPISACASSSRDVGPVGVPQAGHAWVIVALEVPTYAGFYRVRILQLASGSTGGITYQLACYALDVIKSHIQLRSTPPTGTPVQYIAREARAIVSEGGVADLFRGLSPSHASSLLSPSLHVHSFNPSSNLTSD
ncbi:hypothetical protein B0H11DRAFT_2226726 [Mycena galericulata]|nr:hypothetical protein B0H11DRAFT_2226726 [Mycena galericulata]